MVRRKPSEKKRKLQSETRCALCRSDCDDPFRYGELGVDGRIAIHNFCALFASGLYQNGDVDEGIEGFLVKDIKNEVRRATRLRCIYCKHGGATIGCSVKICRKAFHLQCGQENGALNQFFGSYVTFCRTHRPGQEISVSAISDWDCSICGGSIDSSKNESFLKTACCLSGLFHRDCIQKYANSAGYFFKCPLCNNVDAFREEMLYQGICIPEKDAAWETEENAYEELLDRPSCGAENCVCPEGKDTDKKNTIWFLQICADCGGNARHVGCDQSSSIYARKFWQCPTCTSIMNDKNKRNRSTPIQLVPVTPLGEEDSDLLAGTSNENVSVGRRTRSNSAANRNDTDSSEMSVGCTNENILEKDLTMCNHKPMTSTINHEEEVVVIFDANTDKFVDVCTIDGDSCQEMPISQSNSNEVDRNLIQLDNEKINMDGYKSDHNFDTTLLIDLTGNKSDNSKCHIESKNVLLSQKAEGDEHLAMDTDLSVKADVQNNSQCGSSNNAHFNAPASDNNKTLHENDDLSFNLLQSDRDTSSNLHDERLESSTSAREIEQISPFKQQASLEKYLSFSCTHSRVGNENSDLNNVHKRRNDSSKHGKPTKRKKNADLIAENKTLFEMCFFQQDKNHDRNTRKGF